MSKHEFHNLSECSDPSTCQIKSVECFIGNLGSWAELLVGEDNHVWFGMRAENTKETEIIIFNNERSKILTRKTLPLTPTLFKSARLFVPKAVPGEIVQAYFRSKNTHVSED